jgi:hypothetical protein
MDIKIIPGLSLPAVIGDVLVTTGLLVLGEALAAIAKLLPLRGTLGERLFTVKNKQQTQQ